MFTLDFTEAAQTQLDSIESFPALAKRAKAVLKALGYLQVNPRHPSLNTHKFHGIPCPHGEDLFEAYAENNTPGAYRIFFCYSPETRNRLVIVAITPHP